MVANDTISQTSDGIITADQLGVRQDAGPGNILLDDANVVNTFAAARTVPGQVLTFKNTKSLDIGAVDAVVVDGTSFIATSGVTMIDGDALIDVNGSLTLLEQLNVRPGGNVRLLASGDMTQSASGAITANQLGLIQRASTGVVTLDKANDVNTLAAENTAAGQTIAFNDTDDLTIDTVATQTIGLLTFATTDGLLTSNGDILLNADGALSINQQLNAGTADVRITAEGNITQSTTGIITGDQLGVRQESIATGDIALDDANVVNTLGAFNAFAGGSIAFNNTQALVIDTVATQTIGMVDFAETIGVATSNGDVLINADGPLSINQQLLAGTADARVAADGNITQSATGNITADEFAVRQQNATGGNIELSDNNDVNTLAASNVFVAGTIAFNDVDDLTLSEVLTASSGPLTIVTTTGIATNNGDILLNADGTFAINEAISSGTADTRLVSDGAITQTTGGTITADELSVRQESAVGDIVLDDANDVEHHRHSKRRRRGRDCIQ